MHNPVGNAVKLAAHQRKALIEIGCRREDNEHVFYVRENGISIDPRYTEKMLRTSGQNHTTNHNVR